MFYDRNPKSMSTIPGGCPAGRDSVPLDQQLPRIDFENRLSWKIFLPLNLPSESLQGQGFDPKTHPGRNFLDFRGF